MPVVEMFVAGAAVGAAAVSTKVRDVARKGIVYGLAGGLMAYDTVAAFASGVVRGARESMSKPATPSASNPQPASPEASSPPSPAPQPQSSGTPS